MTENTSLISTESGFQNLPSSHFSDFEYDKAWWDEDSVDVLKGVRPVEEPAQPWTGLDNCTLGFDINNVSMQWKEEGHRNEDGVTRLGRRVEAGQSLAVGEINAKRIKSRRSGGVSDKHKSNEDDQEKRERFLERNRLAAGKCRERKKAWTNELEQQARVLATQREILNDNIMMLENELIALTYKCLEHRDCECSQIRHYLANTITAQLILGNAAHHRGSISTYTSEGTGASPLG